jgi:hypothetical protein
MNEGNPELAQVLQRGPMRAYVLVPYLSDQYLLNLRILTEFGDSMFFDRRDLALRIETDTGLVARACRRMSEKPDRRLHQIEQKQYSEALKI